jgi:hypothetical protein
MVDHAVLFAPASSGRACAGQEGGAVKISSKAWALDEIASDLNIASALF